MDIDQIAIKVNVLTMPLRDVVVFPGSVMPLFVGREHSINTINASMKGDRQLFLITQQKPELENPSFGDLYKVGTLVNILQALKLPDGTVKILVEGLQRFEILNLTETDGILYSDISALESDQGPNEETKTLLNVLKERFFYLASMRKKLPSEVKNSVEKTQNADKVVDLVSANLIISLDSKQNLLNIVSINDRIEQLMAYIEEDIDLHESEKRITMRVKKQMDKSQRDYYLNEKIKAIYKELGRGDEDGEDDVARLERQILSAGMPKIALKKALAELNKFKLMQPQSADANVLRNYLDWMVRLPWKKRSRISKDLRKAIEVLDQEHYGLEKVKERIIEYLAVMQRVNKIQGPILCLVGPPGVGKTSLARSIATATNRKYVRMALGGVRDEAEIRGHRKTYIGAMPGRIIQKMTDAGTKNPLFLLDEVDKMARDMRGDPASALLEVLDPEQNNSFNDHYMEVDYDLSDVMFIATSNSMDIPEALLDRMEIIELAGYTEPEKINIALEHLLPKQLKNHGLTADELAVTKDAILQIIQIYTREAGVRGLDRSLSKICRKAVRKLVEKSQDGKITVDANNLKDYLGVARYRFGIADKEPSVGQVAGLAWTRVGGDLLRIEAVSMPGKGKLDSTGQLGSVMSESVQASMSVIRSRSADLGLKPDFYEKIDLHLHFPEGAIKKDGPSAGIAICTAITSALTGIPVRSDVAMTGEITLRGEVLPIGGLKEKLLAALRGGIKLVLIPEGNERDLAEIEEEVKSKLEIKPVKWIDEVLELSLVSKPERLDLELNQNSELLAQEALKNIVSSEIKPH